MIQRHGCVHQREFIGLTTLPCILENLEKKRKQIGFLLRTEMNIAYPNQNFDW